ncbi:hypothetical protein P8879_02175 [Bacillus spizizenii]|nr:hypothetical protein JN25_19520 [Bacillus sp. BSC154]MCY7829968.1 hypothetical protein [Bacillus spizizenii]MCY7842766.1 hypothetical protein [Bacillus spizizenii]MCY9315802.1 hypothetical protein [Bacillus spizizenii]MEC0560538.1 hypothetical protein [Bacillus spizizenii]
MKINFDPLTKVRKGFTIPQYSRAKMVDERVKQEIRKKMEKLQKEISKELNHARDDFRYFKKIMVEMGFPPHEEMEVKKMRKIVDDYKTKGKKYVESYLDDLVIAEFGIDFLSERLKYWEKHHEFLKKRMPLLRSCIRAHNLGMYYLVVPALLTQLEGIIFDSFKIKGSTTTAMLKKAIDLLLETKNDDSSISFHDNINKYYKEKILSGFSYGKPVGTDVSRHAILHGYDLEFGKEIVSLKVILLLDYIIEAVDCMDSSKIPSCREEINKLKYNRKR